MKGKNTQKYLSVFSSMHYSLPMEKAYDFFDTDNRRKFNNLPFISWMWLFTVIFIPGLVINLSYLPLVNSYAIYDDEYQNEWLPGSVNDPRGLPNAPFFVDTNRLSNGMSSQSILTTTSPAFPIYKGILSDPELRKSHFWEVKASEKFQGVADSSAGELTRDAAKKELLETRFVNGSFPPNPNTTFPVDAKIQWNPSKFAIQKGQTYRIEVQGDQVWRDANIQVSPEGYKSYYDGVSKCYAAVGRCRPYLKFKRRLISANWMSLVCGIGDYVWKLQEVAFNLERYMPMKENEFISSLFYVGKNITFQAQATGELVCFANDALGLYWNNDGVINATVTILTWPPIKAEDLET